MEKISFIHLSDIHFRKNSDNPADIDSDLREAIITDINLNARERLKNIRGVLVCGDIAFSGQKSEYDSALSFLKRVTDCLGINEFDVFCVPGNHDVNQNIPRSSDTVYEAQYKIDNEPTLDMADETFQRKITDLCCNDILYKPIEAYNVFASKFCCDISAEQPIWENKFDLEHNMSLCLWGMNSCIISNAADNKDELQGRKMYIGQSQIPGPSKDIIFMSLCHHPNTLWKFADELLPKFNKRADIQLFGHMHTQSQEINDNNIILYSGAVHPERGKDWQPRYNWISIEIFKENNERKIKVQIFPRVLSKDRSRFETDKDLVDNSTGRVEHVLNIDQKRKKDLIDPIQMSENKEKTVTHENQTKINLKELVYKFLMLPYLTQTNILINLELVGEDNKGRKYETIMKSIIDKANKEDKLLKLWDKIMEENRNG